MQHDEAIRFEAAAAIQLAEELLVPLLFVTNTKNTTAGDD